MEMNSGDDFVDAAQGLSGGLAPGSKGALFGLSMSGVLASLLFSGVGIFYFKRGKATNDMPMLVSGIALLVYPFFITDTLYIVVVGLALTALPWWAQRCL
jgi:hypothetical protein